MNNQDFTERPASYLHLNKDIENIIDCFSASWLMNINRFMDINIDKIQTCEDACFQPLRQYKSHVRMTRDWLEFTVEHMSKWWKIIDIFKHNQTLELFIEMLDRFGHEPIVEKVKSKLDKTIAIIAFMPYGGETIKGQSQALTASMLKACIRSMSRYGIGRVVVVVPTVSDRNKFSQKVPNMFGETTVVFRVAKTVKTKFISTNMPFGAIAGLQQAFKSDDDDWLGNENRWNAVYLTEPDTLLHIKPKVFSDLMNGILNEEWILSPHRLQPIPHESDLPFPLSPVMVVPNNEHHKVTIVDSYTTCCWDSGNDRPYGAKGTRHQHPNKCNNYWYMCGFRSGDHSSIQPYSLMRLSKGIGITMLMGSEHGRQCHIAP